MAATAIVEFSNRGKRTRNAPIEHKNPPGKRLAWVSYFLHLFKRQAVLLVCGSDLRTFQDRRNHASTFGEVAERNPASNIHIPFI
jgi:hypothetical protein